MKPTNISPKPRFRFAVLACLLIPVGSAWASNGQIDLILTSASTGKPQGARLLVRDRLGKIRRFPNSVWQGDATYAFYEANLKLPEGTYFFEIDAGPEYRIFSGNFEVLAGVVGKQEIQLQRTVDLPEEGWWVTELCLSGDAEQLAVMLDAAGVDVAGWNPKPAKKSRRKPSFHAPTAPRSRWVSAAQWESPWGGRFYLLSPRKPDFEPQPTEDAGLGSDAKTLQQWRQANPGSLVIADSALATDLPLWLGLDLIDGVGVLPWFLGQNAETLPSNGYDVDRKTARQPIVLGQQNVERYFELLECGLKLPACAASQWSTPKQPLASNRMLIAASEDPTDLIGGLRDGNSWVTNGPLLRVTANRELPGHTFTANAGQRVALNLALRVSTRYKLRFVEVIKNGEVVQSIDLKELVKARGKIPPIEFDESGWMVVRGVAEDQEVYRAAITSPFYVDLNQQPRISRVAVERVSERLEQFVEDHSESDLPAELVGRARRFWQERLESATAP